MNKTRLRIGTLMLLVVIVALCLALGIQERRATHLVAELRRQAAGREAELKAKIAEMEQDDFTRWKGMNDRRFHRTRLTIQPDAETNVRGRYRFPFPPAE